MNTVIRFVIGLLVGAAFQYFMGYDWETRGHRPFLIAFIFLWLPVERLFRRKSVHSSVQLESPQ